MRLGEAYFIIYKIKRRNSSDLFAFYEAFDGYLHLAAQTCVPPPTIHSRDNIVGKGRPRMRLLIEELAPNQNVISSSAAFSSRPAGHARVSGQPLYLSQPTSS